MNKFTHAVSIAALDKDGNVLTVGTNHPNVDPTTGELFQKPIATIMAHFSCLNIANEIADLKVEHIPLEGDYEVWCPPEHLSDFGLRYALASCYNWIDPVTNTKIIHKDGELTVMGKFDILNLDGAFHQFDPWVNKALAWQVMLDFGVSIYFDHNRLATFTDPERRTYKQWTDHPVEILRRLLVVAIGNRMNRPGNQWDGRVPLSMVKPTFNDAVQKVADAIGTNDTSPDTGLAP